AVLSSLPVSAGMAATADELAQIREQLQGLMQRVDKLEQENQTLKTENEDLKAQDDYLKAEARGLRKEGATVSTAVGNLRGGEWASRVTLTGDVRYRYEMISDDTVTVQGANRVVTADRYRDRIRARFNAVARATDNITVGLGFATTEGQDPRSSNQTLTNTFSRKSLELDLGYIDWKFSSWGNLIGGKMRQPFFKPGQTLYWDGDINPEGIAFTFNRGIWFGSAYNYWLTEVSGLENTTTSDPMLHGAQVGVRLPIGSSTLTTALHYYDLSSGQFRSPFYVAPGATLGAGNANNNTTCVPTIPGRPAAAAPTLAFDYEVLNLGLQFDTTFASLPVMFWADFAQNQDPSDLETTWAAGALFGRASNYRTWELGAFYQVLEKDALFAQLIDSDFAGGLSDSEGWVIKAGYAPIRNWALNLTYFLNKRNMDVANSAAQTEVDYNRLQVDFNVKF
ncbi:MAG: putative porin, partial [Steroidobacteraceae bacterium]